jgi:Replication initiation factor
VEALPCREQIMVGREGKVPSWKFDHAVGIDDGKARVANVRWGGNGGGVSIEIKGSVANETYGLVRAHFPGHRVTRMDVAVDRTAPGLFDQALQALQALAKEQHPPVSMEPAGKGWYDEAVPRQHGRTMYFGSNQSDAQEVLYEKGFERIARGGESEADLDWTRLELRLHPQTREGKLRAATLTPVEAWGFTRFTRASLEAFTGLESDLVVLPERQADDDRTYAALLRSFGPFLARKACPDPVGFISAVLRDLDTLQTLKVAPDRLARRRA